MKNRNLSQGILIGITALWTIESCSGADRIRIKNPYKGVAEFDDVTTSFPQFRIFPKGGEVPYKITDSVVIFDFQLNEEDTLGWKYGGIIPPQNRRYILYPAWWTGDQQHYPEILCMRGNRLLNRVRDDIKDITKDDYWMTEEYFKNYYELVKRYTGDETFPFDRINELKELEETARLSGIGLIRTGVQEDQREKVLQTVQSWNGWMLTAVVKDEGGGVVMDYRRNNLPKDKVLQDWLLEVLKLRMDSAHKNYAKNRKDPDRKVEAPDRTVKELCDKHPRISTLLLFDAEFFYSYVYEEPWVTLIKGAIESRPEAIRSVCNELLFGTDFVTTTNPATGQKINLSPVLGKGIPESGHQIHEEMRLAALELAVSILLRKEE